LTSSDFTHDPRPWIERLQCPSCGASVTLDADLAHCSSETCRYSDQGFPLVEGQPVLIDFVDSVFPRSNYESGNGSALRRSLSRRDLRSRLHLLVDGSNPVAAGNCGHFLALIKQQKRHPLILVVGGGVIGLGADRLYSDPEISLVGIDVYASPHTSLLADAHKLPFTDGTFDGVWIQAVLEHVLDPAAVVAELYRVLAPGGLVYAETPFMQQVHERAYDFTRFSQSGHRWLFRRFDEISAGPITGPATVLLWSIRYLLRALGAGEKLAQIIPLMLCWIRVLDRFCHRREAADAAGGVYFLGCRSEAQMPPAAMPDYYKQQARPRKQARWRVPRPASALAARQGR
jgi:SAM-dependent methyltransferase